MAKDHFATCQFLRELDAMQMRQAVLAVAAQMLPVPVAVNAVIDQEPVAVVDQVEQKQMRNHYDYLKTKYTAWLSLRNKTGIYDKSTNTFHLSEEEWKLEILKNKNVESLKTTTLPFPELCAPLFDGTLSAGVKSVGPSSTEPRPVAETHLVIDDEETEVMNVDSPTPSCSSRAPRPVVKTKKRSKQLMDGVEEEISSVLKAHIHDIPLKGMLQRAHQLHLTLKEVVRLPPDIRIRRKFHDNFD
nr:hypothetical protein [Tanacetum cinerariifolium]